jgi:hypothetical protein
LLAGTSAVQQPADQLLVRDRPSVVRFRRYLDGSRVARDQQAPLPVGKPGEPRVGERLPRVAPVQLLQLRVEAQLDQELGGLGLVLPVDDAGMRNRASAENAAISRLP